MLFYGYATGVFSARMIEKATPESLPFRVLAGDLPPDHDTIAHFRKMFLPEVKDLFVQILWLAQAADVLKLGNISLALYQHLRYEPQSSCNLLQSMELQCGRSRS